VTSPRHLRPGGALLDRRALRTVLAAAIVILLVVSTGVGMGNGATPTLGVVIGDSGLNTLPLQVSGLYPGATARRAFVVRLTPGSIPARPTLIVENVAGDAPLLRDTQMTVRASVISANGPCPSTGDPPVVASHRLQQISGQPLALLGGHQFTVHDTVCVLVDQHLVWESGNETQNTSARFDLRVVVEQDGIGESATGRGTTWPGTSAWFQYTQFTTSRVDLVSGRKLDVVGDVRMTRVNSTWTDIRITMRQGWYFGNVAESVKIHPMAKRPTSSIPPGHFASKFTVSGNDVTLRVPTANFYGIHIDAVRVP
jgi:hypothetical protein